MEEMKIYTEDSIDFQKIRLYGVETISHWEFATALSSGINSNQNSFHIPVLNSRGLRFKSGIRLYSENHRWADRANGFIQHRNLSSCMNSFFSGLQNRVTKSLTRTAEAFLRQSRAITSVSTLIFAKSTNFITIKQKHGWNNTLNLTANSFDSRFEH